MPSRNSIKQFQPETSYHVYNRGAGKADIFRDKQDYEAFSRRLMLMLLPEHEAEQLQHSKNRIRLLNLSDRIQLQAYCLMPNHFHLMLRQIDETAITRFMRVLTISYSMYFNRKYDRVGPLFQGRFKAAQIDSDSYFMHLSRYIHCNPVKLHADIYEYPYSSLKCYFKSNTPHWLKPKMVEEQFSGVAEYRGFVNDLKSYNADEETYGLD